MIIGELFSDAIRKKGGTRFFGGSEAKKRLTAFCGEQGVEFVVEAVALASANLADGSFWTAQGDRVRALF